MGEGGSKTKVVVLGGGVAGITAAFELTATPELRERYEVTVIQMGWRLGGKCASGRNAAMGNRIEEHGLHVWFGFYANAFSLMQRCYEELDRPKGVPLATFDEAFAPCDQIVLGEEYDGRWLLHSYDAPRNDRKPGSDELPTLWELVSDGIQWALREWLDIKEDLAEVPDPEPRTGWRTVLDQLAAATGLDDLEATTRAELLRTADRAVYTLLDDAGHAGRGRRTAICGTLRLFRNSIWRVLEQLGRDDDRLRHFAMTVDLGAALLTGIIDDHVLRDGFDHLEDEELRAWLRRHGADPYTVDNSPIIRGWYAGGFAFRDGDPTQPDVAAGTALHAILRIFTYQGSVLRKMQAGMGETVFTPLYEVLKARGVQFAFFHRIAELHLDATESEVAAIDVVVQADLVDGTYDPLVSVKGLACWPSEPHWDQLRNGAVHQASGLDFEHGQDQPGAPVRTLRIGEDFDEVVLAIPVAGLASICPELLEADQKFANMVANIATTRTQAIQLWAQRSPADLGWDHHQDSILTSYIEPLDTYADMTHLLQREDWPDDAGAANIAYFCGVLPEDGDHEHVGCQAKAMANAIAFVGSEMGPLWPNAQKGDGEGFDWDVLVDHTAAVGPDRLKSQYVRANVVHSERYTLSLAGSTKFRLKADETKFTNLALAGDWTRNGIDAGCVEATVMSGMQAARAIRKGDDPIVGEHRAWLET